MKAFLDLADRQISAPVKAHHRAAEKRAARREQEREQLTVARQQYERGRLVEALAGKQGERLKRLLQFLETMTLRSAAELIGRAREFQAVDADLRFQVLHLIDDAIVRLRERHKLLPFDDPLPGQPPNAFLIIR